MKAVGDHLAFVLPAYIFVFGIWTVASSYDYISGKWQPVASARRRGMRHLVALILPMMYMGVYIKFQHDAEDAKEMSGGILAFLFAFVEFCRTVVGLWQLHVFRHWVAASVQSLESLGYVPQRRKGDGEAEDDNNDGSDQDDRTDPHADGGGDDDDKDGPGSEAKPSSKTAKSGPKRRTPLQIADSLVINDLVVDNRLSEGEIEVILRVRNSGRIKNWKQCIRVCAHWLSCIWHLPRLLVAICLSRKPLFSSPAAPISIQPYDAEDIFMRWACVLVAQAFPHWLEDMHKSGMSDMTSKDGLSQQIARFRRGLLCCAALHTQSDVHIQIPKENQGPSSGVMGHSHLNFGVWHKYPKLCNGVFSLQEFLCVACESGTGLPFGEPHAKARAGGNDSEFSYSKFESKLYRIREMFPVDDVEVLERFETCHLEWLAVFLSVPDWRPETSSIETPDQAESCLPASPFNSTRIAMDNLRSQLGLLASSSPPAPFFSDLLTRFPLFKKSLRRTAWGKRNLLEASLHIDNILALSAGAQLQFMAKMKTLTSERIWNAWKSLGVSQMTHLYSSSEASSKSSSSVETDASFENEKEISSEKGERRGEKTMLLANAADSKEAITDDHSSLEADRFLYQLVGEEPEAKLLEHRTTFLGCSMERLRSSLAVWVQNNPSAEKSVWCPLVEESETNRPEEFTFYASDRFAQLIRQKNGSMHLGDRHVQMRLLWELQSFFHGLIHEEGLSPLRHEAMILCLLSFPAVYFRISDENEDCELNTKNTPDGVNIAMHQDEEEAKLVVSVPFGPQSFGVALRVKRIRQGLVNFTVSISGEGQFRWELWRNDFTNRLEASKSVQESNGLEFSPVIRTSKSISHGVVSAEVIACGTGQEMRAWPGWLPHRPSMCMFEIESDGFIIQVKKKKLDLAFSQEWDVTQSTGLIKSSRVPVHVSIADDHDLEHASTVARKVLFALAAGTIAESHLMFDGRNVLEDTVKEVSGATEEPQREFRLKLSEAVAVHHRNLDVLENAVLYLCRTEKTSDVLSRAASMIESFCSLVGESKPTFQSGAPGLSMDDEGTMLRVLSLVDNMASETYVSHDMCKSFSRICTSFVNCDNLKNMQQASMLLRRNILSASHQLDERGVRALIKDLGSILGRIGRRHDPIAVLLFTRFSDEGESGWYSNGYDALRGSTGPASPTLAATLFSIGASEKSDGRCLKGLGGIYHHGCQNNPSEPARASDFYARGIVQGDPVDAMFNLAVLLENGAPGVVADPARAVELYRRAVDEGAHIGSMCHLGLLLEEGAQGVDPDPRQAVELWSRAIDEAADVDSMTNLADLLAEGAYGVDADPQRAVELYSRAIDEGAHVGAMFNLGLLLEDGAQDVDADLSRAVELWSRAIDEGGHVGAMFNLGLLVEEGRHDWDADPVRAVGLYSRAIDEGAHPGAMYVLANMLKNGAQGVDPFPARAVELYNRAIDEGGDVDAMTGLAALLEEGAQGVDADPGGAADLYSRAIKEEADVDAMNSLALLLQNGAEGVSADPERAVELYGRAVEEGNVFAMENLADLLEKGASGVSVDPARAEILRNRAVDMLLGGDVPT